MRPNSHYSVGVKVSDNNPLKITKGRGAVSNDEGRFNKNRLEIDMSDYGWFDEEDKALLKTQFFNDSSKSIISENKSPDIPFRYSLNSYRGCEHGCVYCYARPSHEYLGLSAGQDFESKIFVKRNAAELLREKFMSKSWKPESITMSGITDCYQPAERKFELTRKCLEVFREFKHPVSLITKNALITRDVDILSDLARDELVKVYISVTTLDPELGRTLEPRTSAPQARINAIETLAKAGVPVGVNVAPIIPGLTDHELPKILKASADAGATSSGYTVLRLPYSVSDIFVEWLEKHRPDSKEKVLQFLRGLRDGKLYDAEWGSRMVGKGQIAENIGDMFELFSRKFGLREKDFNLRCDLFQRPGDQFTLF